ncbi:hypothetical protein RKD32_005983 [Streptomyces sp. SAI-195]|uniref:hypothetical protein n=1 Tax=unclassified Streptomyces TaxID=2593676 RepID=UPI003448237C
MSRAQVSRTPVPVDDTTQGTDVTVEIDRFASVFAADVAPRIAAVLAVSQRPLAVQALTEKAPTAAWKTKPSWGLVATADRAVSPEMQRYGCQRAGRNHDGAAVRVRTGNS